MEPLQATRNFNTAPLTLRDIAGNESSINTFIQKELRHAEHMGTLDVQVWSNMSLHIRQNLRPPFEDREAWHLRGLG